MTKRLTTITSICLAAIFSCSVSLADLVETDLKQSILSINAYVGKEVVQQGAGFIVQSDRYNGYIVTNSILVTNRDTLTVSLPGNGAELVAQIVQIDPSFDFAVLKVNGLNLPPLAFSLDEVKAGDVVWSAVRLQTEGSSIGLSKGSLRSAYSLAANNIDLLSHNAIVGNGGGGSVLVNDCGQVLGLNMSFDNADSYVSAIGSSSLRRLLKQQNIKTTRATNSCISEVTQAKDQAVLATQEAQKAKEEAARAQEAAAILTTRLESTNRRNKTLVAQVKAAQESAEAAIQAAESAQQKAAQTRIDLDQTAASILAETQTMIDHLNQDRQESEARFNEVIETQKQDSENRELKLVTAFVLFSFILMGMVIFLQLRSKSAAPKAKKKKLSSVHDPKAPLEDMAEYVLDGRDEDGIRYLLRISGDQMCKLDGVIIGRNPKDSPYIINHADVSRKHARLKVLQDKVFIEDLGSTNGTSVNGQTIDDKGPISVNTGDQIIIGSVVMKLRVLNG